MMPFFNMNQTSLFRRCNETQNNSNRCTCSNRGSNQTFLGAGNCPCNNRPSQNGCCECENKKSKCDCDVDGGVF